MHGPNISTLAKPVVPSRRWYILFAVGFLALAIYGSLVPFRYQFIPWEGAKQRWSKIHFFQENIQSRSDFVANILLFIPLGFMTMGAICADRRRWLGFVSALLVLPAGFALSLAIEFTQIYFPPRTVSINDIVAETAGAVLGTLLWLIWGQGITNWVRSLSSVWFANGLAATLLPGYLLFVILIHVMPLDLTISPVEVYRKIREGKVVLIPFLGVYHNPFGFAGKTFWTTVYFLPLGTLLAFLPQTSWQDKRHWHRVLFLGLAFAAWVEFLQLFVYTRYCDVTDIIIGGFCPLIGWSSLRAWCISRENQILTSKVTRVRDTRWRWAGFGIWLILAVIATWQPFNFVFEWDYLIQRWQKITFIPFADYYAGTEYNAFDQFLHKALLYVPLGVLCAFCRPVVDRRFSSWVVVFLGFALATSLELGQLLLPGRYAGITDVLVETGGAWLGYTVFCRLPLFRLTKKQMLSGTTPVVF